MSLLTDDSNIRLLHTDPDQMIAHVEQLRRYLPELARIAPEIASARYVFYQAYIKAGFDEQQALELCCSLEM